MDEQKIKEEIESLSSLLSERKKSLPAHSIRPHQIIAIEELEEKLADLKAQLKKIS